MSRPTAARGAAVNGLARLGPLPTTTGRHAQDQLDPPVKCEGPTTQLSRAGTPQLGAPGALGPVSAAFNPVVTLVERALGLVTTLEAAVLVAVQVTGCCVGVMIANLMYDEPAVFLSQHSRGGSGQLLGEVVATLGLVVVIFGVLRSGRGSVALAVGGYIAAAYWFTSSTSFANPAITVARTLSDTFAGIDPSSVLAFIGAQLIGGLLAYGAVRILYPEMTS